MKVMLWEIHETCIGFGRSVPSLPSGTKRGTGGQQSHIRFSESTLLTKILAAVSGLAAVLTSMLYFHLLTNTVSICTQVADILHKCPLVSQIQKAAIDTGSSYY